VCTHSSCPAAPPLNASVRRHDDPRCAAGVDIDGAPLGTVVRDGVRRPLLFLMGDHSHEDSAESRQTLAAIRSIYDRLPADERELVTIAGTNYFPFIDGGALLESHLASHLSEGRPVM